MKRYTLLFSFVVFLMSWSVASYADSEVINYFEEKLNKINTFLSENHEAAKKKPSVMAEFVDDELLNVWSAKNTLRSLLGPSRWKSIASHEQQYFIKTYQNTIRRYLFEVMSQYNGQLAKVQDIRLNSAGNKGWLRVSIQSDTLPELDVDLRIYRDDGIWTVYDFSFQGISFVKMKRRFFRSTFDSKGVEPLIRVLESKNKAFKSKMVASE